MELHRPNDRQATRSIAPEVAVNMSGEMKSNDVEISEKRSDVEINAAATPFHHYDAETANIVGEIPLHPAPKGPHESISDLKDELMLEEPEDLFKPFPIDKDIPEEEDILTVRGKSAFLHNSQGIC